MFLHHLARWPSVDIGVKFYGDRPRGTPPSGELTINTRGVAEYSDFDLSNAVSRKQCKIEGKLVITNRKSIAYELSIGTKMQKCRPKYLV